ncbi:DUF6788 family protein [Thermogemmatispora sp.]|uniref:DUF6788 family protein n=1 Tax=Thermogemmatispora sp. TaxID=1968838 RepID=UPI002ACBF546|nr:DUF6788 family protein [Thermogemmatispora sp.]
MAQIPSDPHITYQLQYRKCGKPTCSTCRDGQGHGPYWYAYWREGSRLRSGYVGKERPADDKLPERERKRRPAGGRTERQAHRGNPPLPLVAVLS